MSLPSTLNALLGRLGAACIALVAISPAVGCDAELPNRPTLREGTPDPEDSIDYAEIEISARMEVEIPPEYAEIIDPETRAVPGRLTPERVFLRIFEVKISDDPVGCTNAVSVASNPSPGFEDFSDGGSLMAGAAPVGDYGCVIVTVDDDFWWRDNTGNCASDTFQRLHGLGADTIDIYLTTGNVRDMDPSFNGRTVYAVDEGFFFDGVVNRTELVVNPFGVVDLSSCTLDAAPTFNFGPA